MTKKRLSRRDFLRIAALGAAGSLLGACAAPTPQVIKETVEVEKVVEKTVEVEKIVEKTVMVEPTATPEYDPFADIDAPGVEGHVTWYLGGDAPFYYEIADAFMAEHPDIEVEPMPVPWGEWGTKAQTMWAAGELPDIIWFLAGQAGLSLDIHRWTGSGALMDLSPFMDEITEDDFVDPSLLKNAMSEGKLWGLPFEFNNQVLFYNKDLFDADGLDYPTEDWTWEDVVTNAAALTKREGDRATQFGYRYNQFEDITYMEQAGTRMFADDMSESNFHTDATKTAWNHMHRLYVEEAVSPLPGETSGFNELDTGVIAMNFHGNFRFNRYKSAEINFGSVIMPKGPGPDDSNRFTMNRENIWGVSRNTKNAEATLAFAKFLGFGKGLEMWAATGRLVPYKNFTVDDYVEYGGVTGSEYEATFRELMENVLKGASNGKPAQILPAHMENNNMATIVGDEMFLMTVEQSQDVETTLSNIKQKMDGYLASGW